MNQFGHLFRIQVFGESHGKAVGVTIDGCPPGIHLAVKDFLADINRRKGGKAGTTKRMEDDIPEIISGVYKGKTGGTPVTIIFANKDARSGDYNDLSIHPRPGHADYAASIKYKGFCDLRGGGHFSGRLTLPLVAAGVVARKIIPGIDIMAKITEAGGKRNFDNIIHTAEKSGDSIGGIVECRAINIPAGFGDPFFNSVESLISHLAFAIPAVKGIEFGQGFESARLSGSQVNDVIIDENGKTLTNNSGGATGGITNGNKLYFRLAIKPASSISSEQVSYNFGEKEMKPLKIKGRHDTCIALRIPVVAEAITAIVLADLKLQNDSIQ